jgi:hypothetical protein
LQNACFFKSIDAYEKLKEHFSRMECFWDLGICLVKHLEDIPGRGFFKFRQKR